MKKILFLIVFVVLAIITASSAAQLSPANVIVQTPDEKTIDTRQKAPLLSNVTCSVNQIAYNKGILVASGHVNYVPEKDHVFILELSWKMASKNIKFPEKDKHFGVRRITITPDENGDFKNVNLIAGQGGRLIMDVSLVEMDISNGNKEEIVRSVTQVHIEVANLTPNDI